MLNHYENDYYRRELRRNAEQKRRADQLEKSQKVDNKRDANPLVRLVSFVR